MPLNCEIGNWDRFIRKYRRTDSQWYLIPKAKTYSEDSIKLIIQGLRILDHWLNEPESLPKQEREYLQGVLQDPENVFPDDPMMFRWGKPAEAFLTAKLFKEEIISRGQQDEKLRLKFDEIIHAIEDGTNYSEVLRSFGRNLLETQFSANSRNFINICQKLGLAWIEPDHLVTVTSVGKRLIDDESDHRPLLEHQLRKLQFYNPTFHAKSRRYGHIKVFPFNFCLKLIVGLHPHQINKNEFALFVTKATLMGDVDRCLSWINKFRNLSDEQRTELIQRVGKPQRGRRPLLTEAYETASKNINLLTLSGPWQKKAIDGSEGMALTDMKRARKILSEDRRLQVVDFETTESWLGQYGNISAKYDIDDAIEYYARIGKIEKAKRLAEKSDDVEESKKKLEQRLREKQVENFFRDNLKLIEPGLKLYKKGNKTGQQFETPDGGILDLLTVTPDGKFVVIELKRDQTSDETVGQTLRYMGWVKRNLAPPKSIVRGYIVARDFDKYVTYALFGMQHPLIPNSGGKDLLQLYKHSFDVSSMGIVGLDALDA